MLDVRSRLLKFSQERRKNPRLEIRCQVFLIDLKGVAELTDFSFSGFFAEISDKEGFELGLTMNVAIKFPTEENAILQKVKIVNINKRGIGCQFVDITPNNLKAIKNCFEAFRNTLPIS